MGTDLEEFALRIFREKSVVFFTRLTISMFLSSFSLGLGITRLNIRPIVPPPSYFSKCLCYLSPTAFLGILARQGG